MSKTNEMVEALENLIIGKSKEMKINDTSPEEIAALTELVKVVNQTPRIIELFDLKEPVAVSTSASDN